MLHVIITNFSGCTSSSSHFNESLTMKKARLQVDPDTISADDRPAQTGTVFNIWFLKWAGGDSSLKVPIKLRFRVNIAKDSGTTKAADQSSICLFFARGCCYKGSKCRFKHRLPLADRDYFIPTQDCFGRDRTSRADDVDGVASLHRHNRTLYVAGLVDAAALGLQAVVSRHFGEFGDLETVKVLPGKRCAFVTYRTEAEAQFAKEAMDSQSLDGNEVLAVRWASEDPNPNAKKDEEQRLQLEAIRTVKRMLGEVETEKNQQDQIQKRQKTSQKLDKSTIDIVDDVTVAEGPQPLAEPVKKPLIRPETILKLAQLRKHFQPIHKERLVDYSSTEE